MWRPDEIESQPFELNAANEADQQAWLNISRLTLLNELVVQLFPLVMMMMMMQNGVFSLLCFKYSISMSLHERDMLPIDFQ